MDQVQSITDNKDANRTQTFTYDELVRVKTAQGQGTSGCGCWGQSYTYDRYANLTQAASTKCSSPAPCWTVDSANRITKTCSEGSQTIFYDAAGNITNDHGVTYMWNAEGRLAAAGGVNYTYDGDGRRVKKDSGKLYWRTVTGEVLAETDLSGTNLREYVYFEGRAVARRDANGTVYYFFHDRLGSLRKITNASGGVVRDIDYNPWGTETCNSGTVDDPHKFTGHELDGESGLYHTLYRKYSPTLGRWLSRDPVQGIPQQPQSLNLYPYVWDDPLNRVDPDGDFHIGFWDYPWIPWPGLIVITCSTPENKTCCCPYYDQLARTRREDDQLYGRVAGRVCRNTGGSCWENCVRRCLVKRDIQECRPLPSPSERTTCRVAIHFPKCFLNECGPLTWTVIPPRAITIPLPIPIYMRLDIKLVFSCRGLY